MAWRPPPGRGFWAVTRHADVWTVDRDFQTYSSEPTIMISDPLSEGGGFGPSGMRTRMRAKKPGSRIRLPLAKMPRTAWVPVLVSTLGAT